MSKFLYNVDLNLNQLLNAVIQQLASDPGSPTEGQIWYNTTSNLYKGYDGSTVVTLGTSGGGDADTLEGQAGSYYLSRTNHTGTQAASTISDLATVVQAYRLDQFAAPTASVSLNSQKITNLATPTADNDAANKGYVDSVAQGLSAKESVKAATTANITLSGEQTIDGVSISSGDRVLVKNQSTGAENGIYVASSSTWTRASDADSATDLNSAYTFVEEGSTYANTGWVMTTDSVTLDTTALTWTQFSGAGTYTAGTGLSLSGGQFSIDTASGYGVRKYSASIGDNSTTAIAVTHSLNTRDVQVSVVEAASPYEHVFPKVESTDANNVTLTFTTAPTTNQYRVIVTG